MPSLSSKIAGDWAAAYTEMRARFARHLEAVFPAVAARHYAWLIRSPELEDERAGLLGRTIRVARHRVGAIGAVVPRNYPQTLAMFKLAPAMAMGCMIVIKPSLETVLDSLVLAEAAQDAGVPVSLELEGKSAAIMLEDADLSSAAEALFGATLLNNGQTCYLGTHVLAPRSRYGEIVETFAKLAERGIDVTRSYVGEYCTSLDMAGASLKLVKLDDELNELFDAPAEVGVRIF